MYFYVILNIFLLCVLLFNIQLKMHMVPKQFYTHSQLFDPIIVSSVSILIVGVGGIGCELLKVLSKSPIKSIHIIDMDTIQLSNLNRQFLFKTQHKGKSKALVARQTILKLNPSLKIQAHHKNIRELPISFFKQFSFLVMALDNIETRNYVNKIGVRMNIPIIDAGTLAYLGNARLIIPKTTSCYACEPKSSSQKSFPVCTIRMRPEKPIHCVVWGKMLFQVFFGHTEHEGDMQQKERQEGDMDDLSQLTKKSISQIFLQLFCTQIQAIKNAKTQSDTALSEMYMKKIHPIQADLIQKCAQISSNTSKIDQFDQYDDKLSLQTHFMLAQQSYQRLLQQKQKEGSIIFEKDDDIIIHFIAAMANIRMKCFSIEDGNLSFNQIKNMAGNIVPAIASTNSIASGLQVLEMMKYLVYEGQTKYLKSYFIQNQSYKIRGMNIEQPNSQCLVCSENATPAILQADFNTCKLATIIQIMKEHLADVQEYSVNLGSKELYNSEEPREIILGKKLAQICNNTYELQLILTDQSLSEKICTIWIIHTANLISPAILSQKPLANRPKKQEQMDDQKMIEGQQQQQDSDIVEMVDQGHVGNDDDEIQIVDNIKKCTDRHAMVDENEENLDVLKKRRKLS